MKLIHIKYLFLVVILITSYSTYGIGSSVDSLRTNKELTKRIKKADRYFDAGPLYYEKALEQYLSIHQDFAQSDIASYKLGVYYTKTTGNHDEALLHLRAAKEKGYIKPDLHYYLGMAFQQSNLLDSALYNYNLYESEVKNTDLPVGKKISECTSAKELSISPSRVIVNRLDSNINSDNEDYAVFLSSEKDKLYYTSRRPTTKGGNLASFDGLYYEDTYVSQKESESWKLSSSLPNRINKKTNDAIIGLSMDGQNMLVYRDINGGDILLSELHKAEWGTPKPIKEINTRYHESSACFSSDQNSIYFISNRPGGYGGKDIYVSTKQENGTWSEPENLGEVVNTPHDETTVFIHPIGDEIYFSSKGHNTMGGYDIFKSNIDNEGKPINVENMGYPINNIGDDISFITSLDNKKGYFASQGENMKDKDIYEISFLGPEIVGFLSNNDDLLSTQNSTIVAKIKEPKIVVREKGLTIIKGVIRDAKTGEFIEATIEVVDNREVKVISTFKSNGETGKFLIPLKSGNEYGITVTADNYMFYSVNQVVEAIEGATEITKDIELNQFEVGNKIVLNNIFFDHDKSTLKNKSVMELEKIGDFLEKNKHLEVEISGHTDSNGSDEYNMGLSDRRAKAVVDYLVLFGINPNRMISAGYGEKQPIDTNDTAEGRAMNRRTEFKITGIEFKNNR